MSANHLELSPDAPESTRRGSNHTSYSPVLAYIILGSQVAICGKNKINSITTMNSTIKGITERIISSIVVSGGIILFIRKRPNPKGGVKPPTMRASISNIPKAMGSNPKALITGT